MTFWRAERLSGSALCFAGRFDLRQRQRRMIREPPAARRQLDASSAPNEQLSADFAFQIACLPAEGGLRSMQPPG